jgi:uncharacterized protein
MPTIEQAKFWYPFGDPTHGYDHMLRVRRLALQIAQAEGADEMIVEAAAILHDAEDRRRRVMRSEQEIVRSYHHKSSAAFAEFMLKEEQWPTERIAAVVHCILAHRFRQPDELPQTLEAQVLFDADKLDAIGAIGVARALAYAVQHGQPIYSRPSPQFVATGERGPGEPHSAYHEYCFKLVHLQGRLFTVTGRQIGEQRHLEMVAFFEALAQEA